MKDHAAVSEKDKNGVGQAQQRCSPAPGARVLTGLPCLVGDSKINERDSNPGVK